MDLNCIKERKACTVAPCLSKLTEESTSRSALSGKSGTSRCLVCTVAGTVNYELSTATRRLHRNVTFGDLRGQTKRVSKWRRQTSNEHSIVMPLTVSHARKSHEIEDTRGLFKEYASMLGVDLCFQDFEN